MSENELVKVYQSAGTGTGTGTNYRSVQLGTSDGSVPVDERELIESRQALKQMAVVMVMTVIVGVGQGLEAIAPQLAGYLDAHLPDYPFLNLNSITMCIMGIAAMLQRRAQAKHKVAVVKALVTEPTRELRETVERKLGE